MPQGDDGHGIERAMIVDDGSTVWTYLPESNEYDAIPTTLLNDASPGDQGDLRPAAMDTFMMWRYRSAADFAVGSKLVRDDVIEFGGAAVDCYVLTISMKLGGYTWWVDKKTSHILREDNAQSSSVFTTLKLSGPLPDGSAVPRERRE